MDGVGSPCNPRDSQESSPTPQFKKASILQRSAFFIVQLSHPYMTTRKTIAFTSWQIKGEIMETVTGSIFLDSKITVDSDCSHEIKRCLHQEAWALLVAQLVKNLPGKWESWVWSPGWEDSLEKGMATHSSILAWRIPWTVKRKLSAEELMLLNCGVEEDSWDSLGL